MLFRLVDKRRWEWDHITWLPPRELPAAPLGDLRTSADCKLSVWNIEDDKSNLQRLIAALAAKRQHADKFDFALFSEEVLQTASIHVEVSRGDSADAEVNKRWHRDLVELSSSKLVELAKLIHQHGVLERFQEKEIKTLIIEGIDAGRINPDTLDKRLKNDVLGT